jgi:hypothetical protein
MIRMLEDAMAARPRALMLQASAELAAVEARLRDRPSTVEEVDALRGYIAALPRRLAELQGVIADAQVRTLTDSFASPMSLFYFFLSAKGVNTMFLSFTSLCSQY